MDASGDSRNVPRLAIDGRRDAGSPAGGTGGSKAAVGLEGHMPLTVDREQTAMPVFLSDRERDITLRSCAALAAFFDDQLQRIPSWHPLHHEWSIQAGRLRKRLRPPLPLP